MVARGPARHRRGGAVRFISDATGTFLRRVALRSGGGDRAKRGGGAHGLAYLRRRRHSHDGIGDVIDGAGQFGCGNVDNGHTSLFEPGVALFVALRPVALSWFMPSISIASLAFAQ